MSKPNDLRGACWIIPAKNGLEIYSPKGDKIGCVQEATLKSEVGSYNKLTVDMVVNIASGIEDMKERIQELENMKDEPKPERPNTNTSYGNYTKG